MSAPTIPDTSWSNPIWHRGYRVWPSVYRRGQWAFEHIKFNGSPNARDPRTGYGATVDGCKAQIDVMEDEG